MKRVSVNCFWATLAGYRTGILGAVDLAGYPRHLVFCSSDAFGRERSPCVAEEALGVFFGLRRESARDTPPTRKDARIILSYWATDGGSIQQPIRADWVERIGFINDLLLLCPRASNETNSDVVLGGSILTCTFFELFFQSGLHGVDQGKRFNRLQPIGELSVILAARASEGMEEVARGALAESLLSQWQQDVLSQWANSNVDFVIG